MGSCLEFSEVCFQVGQESGSAQRVSIQPSCPTRSTCQVSWAVALTAELPGHVGRGQCRNTSAGDSAETDLELDKDRRHILEPGAGRQAGRQRSKVERVAWPCLSLCPLNRPEEEREHPYRQKQRPRGRGKKWDLCCMVAAACRVLCW